MKSVVAESFLAAQVSCDFIAVQDSCIAPAMPTVHSLPLQDGDDDVVMTISSDDDESVEMIPTESATPKHGHPDDRFFHFMEIYSPFRVAASVHKMGMASAASMDVLNGHDLLTTDGRRLALAIWQAREPMFLMTSPPCTMYSELTRLWNAAKMSWDTRVIRQRDADNMLKFGLEMCRLQGQAGRLWCHEHPHRASSWKMDIVSCSCL